MFNSAPDGVRRVDAELELGALVSLGHRVAAHGAGKAALRADRQPRGVDVFSRLVGPLAQLVQFLKLRRLRAHQAKHYALLLRYEAQRRETAGARRIELEQEMVDVRTAEELLGHRVVA